MSRRALETAAACWIIAAAVCLLMTLDTAAQSRAPRARIGQETAVPRHLRDGEESKLPIEDLVAVGERLFAANWTKQDGAGRPLSKGTGKRLSDPTRRLEGPRAFNRISGPDADSCQGCHNAPYGITGGNGDVVTTAFDAADRFDFVTFDRADTKTTSGAVDESRRAVSLQTIGSGRATPGLFGAGYVEMLARQMTADLQRIRDSLAPGQSKPLVSKGISFGTLSRHADGRWDVSRVEGLAAASTVTAPRSDKPSLVLRPWRRDGTAVSLRDVTNDEYNRHHGIQTADRFGVDTDPDGDGVKNEMTRADVTAAVLFEATLPVPGRVISSDPQVERAVWEGERRFDRIHCTRCHVASLPLDQHGWVYSEPGPSGIEGRPGRRDVRGVDVDLTSATLPWPRLLPAHTDPGIVHVPAYTDLKLHDITDPNDASEGTGERRKYLTRRLWGIANQPPYFHHGLFTTMRQAVLAHAGEALPERLDFERLEPHEQDCVIEFLKSLQVLPPGIRDLVVDQDHRSREWPPAGPRS